MWFPDVVNTASNTDSSCLNCRDPKWIACLATGFSFSFILLAISRQSLWIDEAITATYAMQESLSSFAEVIWSETKSEAQMPFGMFQAFLFEKFLGHSEYALRLPNLLWLSLGILAFRSLGGICRMRWLPLLIGVHPMIWFYADEARPYAMQIGVAAVLLWASIVLLRDERIRIGILAIWWVSSFLLCSSSLMAAVLYSVWFWVFAFSMRGKVHHFNSKHWSLSFSAIALLGILAAYYMITLWRGAGGARLWDVGLANVAFAIFEFGGFMAFSPGRIAIREAAKAGGGEVLAALRTYMFPLTLLAISYGACLPPLLRAFRESDRDDRRLLHFCLRIMLISIAAVFLICMVMRFPFWGRHLVALLPIMLLIIAYAIRAAHRRYRPLLLILVLGFLLAGSLYQRFSQQHRKDDYRHAVHVAQSAEAEGLKVLWVANIQAAAYYGYAPELTYREIDDAQDWLGADVVVYSKPDIFDADGQIAIWIKTSGLHLCDSWPAFTLWRRNP